MAQANQLETYNHDIVGIWNRMNRFMEEIQKSQSSNDSLTKQSDITRIETYLDAIDRYHAWVVGQPELDLPKTTPRLYKLDDWVQDQVIENDDLDDLSRLFRLARDEIALSESSRSGAGLSKHHSAILTALITKARDFLNNYIKQTTPLHLPESTPLHAMSGPGRVGA
jgi:hypothetical protein